MRVTVPGSSSITPVIQHWDHASCPKLSDMDVASFGERSATLGYCSITTSYAVRMKQELCRCSALAELGLSPTTSDGRTSRGIGAAQTLH